MFAKKNKFKYFVNVILSPKEDDVSQNEIDTMKKHMIKNHDTIFKISLEEFVDRGMKCENKELSKIMEDFNDRYFKF